MEPEITEVEGHLAPLKKVTPLSKYLAMALFIILPFLGGWIGYTYAPEKVVEVERVVMKEVVTNQETSSQYDTPESHGVVFTAGSLLEGKKYGSFVAERVVQNTLYATEAIFNGNATLVGTIETLEQNPYFDGAGLGGWSHTIFVSSSSASLLPREVNDLRRSWFVVVNPDDFDWSELQEGDEVEFSIGQYNYVLSGTATVNSARLLEIEKSL
jgi:hypothetical protein